MTSHFPLLFAVDWESLLSFVVGLVVFLVWLVNQISDATKKRNMGPPQAPVEPQQPVEAAGNAPQADPLRHQIDEFLRRANQQRQQAGGQVQPAAQKPSQDEIVVLIDEAPPESRRVAPAPGSALKPAATQPQRRPRRERVAKPRGKSVAEHVAERIGSSKTHFVEEVAHLGERVIAADKQFDVQLQKKFEHQLGSLGQQSGVSAYDLPVARSTPAAQIAAMLATPEGIRQAIIVNEILRRPSDRW